MEQTRPEPTTRGALGKTPFAHLLVYSLERRLRGTFELTPPGGEGTPEGWMLLLQDGRPAKARVAAPVPYLGRLLMEQGHITQEQLDATLLELAKNRRLHGQLLVERGLITEATLRAALCDQLARKVDAIFDLPPETTFSYYADWDGLAHWGGPVDATVDPMTLLWRGVSRAPSWEHVHVALARLGQARIRLAKEAQLERLALDEGARRVTDVLRAKPMRASELFALELLPARTGQLLLYLLAITKQIALLGEDEAIEPPGSSGRVVEPPSSSAIRAVPPDSPSAATLGRMTFKQVAVGAAIEEEHAAVARDARRATPTPGESPLRRTGPVAPRTSSHVPPAPRSGAHPPPATTPRSGAAVPPPTQPSPSAPSPATDARRQEIAARFAAVDTASLWEVLGVPVDAPVDAVRAAYFQLAKAWHPDRVPPELADLRPQVVKIFARMNEAYATLADERKRAEYKEQIAARGAAGGADEQAIVQRVLEASLAFQKAEIFFKRGDLAQAEPLLLRALELDDTQADYVALLAWVQATKPGAPTTPEATQTHLRALDKAIALGPRCERAYFYRGMLRKRLGEGAKALIDFRTVCELNPRNVDAQREVRLLEMRQAKSVPPESEGGGLFGRLFKK
jgi:DnaJ-domain-containing protein 1